MPDFYCDLRLLPEGEMSLADTRNAVFTALHPVIRPIGAGKIGVSFPKAYSRLRPDVDKNSEGLAVERIVNESLLGSVLRLHGPKEALEVLLEAPWFMQIEMLVGKTAILDVPKEQVRGHCVVRRVHDKDTASRWRRLRKYLMEKKGLTEAEAAKHMPEKRSELDLPFLALGSKSTKQRQFLLYIEQKTGKNVFVPQKEGVFNSYGLSQEGSTIPWF